MAILAKENECIRIISNVLQYTLISAIACVMGHHVKSQQCSGLTPTFVTGFIVLSLFLYLLLEGYKHKSITTFQFLYPDANNSNQ